MPVKVRFPDGEREVPSHSVSIRSREIGSTSAPRIVQEPDPDPEWTFRAVIGGWVAIAKQPGH